MTVFGPVIRATLLSKAPLQVVFQPPIGKTIGGRIIVIDLELKSVLWEVQFTTRLKQVFGETVLKQKSSTKFYTKPLFLMWNKLQLKLGTKVGIVGGAVYDMTQAGFWGDLMIQIYVRRPLKSFEYLLLEVPTVPELPKVSDASRVLAQSWNRGVIASTEFLMHLPSHVSDWGSAAFKKINDLISDPSPPQA